MLEENEEDQKLYPSGVIKITKRDIARYDFYRGDVQSKSQYTGEFLNKINKELRININKNLTHNKSNHIVGVTLNFICK